MGRALPIAEIRITQISAQLSNWSAKKFELETNLVLLVEYFNSSIMAFEPLIEKWPIGFTLKVHFIYYKVNIGIFCNLFN
jgi:hypothetical protein